jgi:outer membrane biogenesis lipoprotein LolB
MRIVFGPGARLLSVVFTAVVILFLAGCGNSNIVGKWRMAGAENQTVWEFASNGSVLIGEVEGRYKFGDQDRIKIQTPFSTTVYQVKISSDQLELQEPGGSKLEFTRMK